MDQAIQDGVSQRGLPQVVVPVGHGKLAGHQRGAPAMPIIEDLQEVAALLGGEWSQPPVIDHQHIDFGEFRQDFDLTAITCGERQLLAQTG